MSSASYFLLRSFRESNLANGINDAGVGFFMSDGLLKDQSVVEVELNGLGAIRNRMVFD